MTPKGEALGMTTVLNTSGVDKNQFLKYVEKKPAPYADWSRVWCQVNKHTPSSMLRYIYLYFLRIASLFDYYAHIY
jgi:hypothetical protein